MTLKILLSQYSQDDIIKRLIKLYPDQKKNIIGYKNCLKELSILSPKLDEMKILIEKNYDKYDKKYYCHVCAIDKNNQTWAIEFEPWENWLGMEIDTKTYKKYNKLDVICHCLYEMTFAGFSNKKVKKEKDNLKKLLKDCKKEK